MAQDAVLLSIEIPQTNDKKEFTAEQMFAALHGILKPKKTALRDDYQSQDRISFEITAIGQRIEFYVWTPIHLQSFVEEQVYIHYPLAQISTVTDDYTDRPLQQMIVHSTEISLTDNELLPIKTFPSFELDPLTAITTALAKLHNADEEMWVQIVLRPVHDVWHKKSAKMVQRISSGSNTWSVSGTGLSYLGQALGAIVKPPEPTTKNKKYELSERDKTRINGIEAKSSKIGYQIKIRILYAGNDEVIARQRMQAIIGAFKQFNTTHLNGFQSKYPSFDRMKVQDYSDRLFADKGYILNIEEIASVYHLPHASIETPNIAWATTKTAEPPANLPTFGSVPEAAISLFGVSSFRNKSEMFGALRTDRAEHILILGQANTGKTGLLELLTLSDIYYNHGFAIIDPNGDYAAKILQYIPEERMNDVIYLNIGDGDFPIGFNPLDVSDLSSKGHICTELIGILKHRFDFWDTQREYILRNTLLALLDCPDTTLLDVTRLLVDDLYREHVTTYIKDPVIKNFWSTEYASWHEKHSVKVIAPILNQIGSFTANPLIRNIIGQSKNSIQLRQAMDNGKIVIVNLSRGLVGDEDAATFGSLMLMSIQLTAMSRADIPEVEKRQPFYVYIDDFGSLATDGFVTFMGQSRRYGLSATMASQYLSKIDEVHRQSLIDNVGSIISFKVSPEDSEIIGEYYQPQFTSDDLIQLQNRKFIARMNISGSLSVPFSGETLNIPEVALDLSAKIIILSRKYYATDRKTIETTRNTTLNQPLSQQLSFTATEPATNPTSSTTIPTQLETAKAIGNHATSYDNENNQTDASTPKTSKHINPYGSRLRNEHRAEKLRTQTDYSIRQAKSQNTPKQSTNLSEDDPTVLHLRN